MPLESQEVATFILVFGAFAYLARMAYMKFVPEGEPKSGCGSCGSSGSCSSKGGKSVVASGPAIVTIGGARKKSP